MRGAKHYVAVITPDNHVTYREIHILDTDGVTVRVVSGVQEGERVALNLGDSVGEGQHVRARRARLGRPPSGVMIPSPRSAPCRRVAGLLALRTCSPWPARASAAQATASPPDTRAGPAVAQPVAAATRSAQSHRGEHGPAAGPDARHRGRPGPRDRDCRAARTLRQRERAVGGEPELWRHPAVRHGIRSPYRDAGRSIGRRARHGPVEHAVRDDGLSAPNVAQPAGRHQRISRDPVRRIPAPDDRSHARADTAVGRARCVAGVSADGAR